MITTEELKVKLAEYGTAMKDLEEALDTNDDPDDDKE